MRGSQIRNRITYHPTRLLLQILVGCCFILMLCLSSSSVQASTHTVHASGPTRPPTLEVDMGFDSKYKIGSWVPVHVKMSNDNNSLIRGTLSVSTLTKTSPLATSQQTVSPWRFEEPVTLPQHAQQQATLYVPLYPGKAEFDGVIAILRNERGKTLAVQTFTDGVEIPAGRFLAGYLSDSLPDFDPLGIYLPGQAGFLAIAPLNAASMPPMEAVLENFDIIILDKFTTSTLRPDQLLALETWVNKGGILIEMGGPEWKQTLGPLPNKLLPVKVNGSRVLPAGTSLIPPNDPIHYDGYITPFTDALPYSLVASTATVPQASASMQSEVVLAKDDLPLFVKAHQGQGMICYFAVDLADTRLIPWPETNALWNMIFTHTLGDTLLIGPIIQDVNTGPGQLLTHVGVLNMVEPGVLPGPTVILLFLIGYALMLGPLRLFIMKRLKWSRKQSWLLLLSTVVVFSPLFYALSSYQRSASIVDNSVSIIQVNQDGSSAHVTTYSGIFVPNAGDFHLHLPGENLTQPIAQQFLLNNRAAISKKDIRASISTGPNEAQVTLQGLGAWSLHHTITEQDIQFQGGIVAHLALRGKRLVGTIQNTLNSALSDSYVLMPHYYVSIGHLNAGETRQVDLPLSYVNPMPGKTLGDQIVENAGLQQGYFPYTSNQRPQNSLQRHMALLSAIDGAGFTFPPCRIPCQTRGVSSKGTIFITGGRVPNPTINAYEPLLIPNAQATLIGWADQPVMDGATINGWHPIVRQENFLQMPLTFDLSRSSEFPSNIITGHVVDIQSYDAELRLAGIYAMEEGSVTFEMSIPDALHTNVKSFTVTEPDLWAHSSGSGGGLLTSHLQASLYNWLKGAWEPIMLEQDSFTTTRPAPYIGPGGQVLLQVSNKDDSLGSLYFGPATLSLDT